MTFRTAAKTDVGQQREHNEDSVLAVSITEDSALLAVADGMGGHSAGDVASQLALDTLQEELVEGDSLPSRPEWQEILDAAVKQANRVIHEEAADNRQRSGMGTTLVAVLLLGTDAVIANVGDSRAYTVTDGHITQETVDQSLVQELVEQGQITEKEAADHPQRNVISQSLGTDETVEPDLYDITVEGTLLLCSDGLSEEIDDNRIGELISDASTLSDAAETLVEQANENGGSDNISVVLAE